MMKAILEFFSSQSLNILGYTLLHSLWQALTVAIIAIIALRFVSDKSSNIRYAIATASLFATILLSVATYLYLATELPRVLPSPGTIEVVGYTQPTHDRSQDVLSSYLVATETIVQSWLPLFVAIWVTGTILFSLRIVMGWAFVEKLRRESLALNNEWSIYIQRMTSQLHIDRIVFLAESAAIQAPIVIGYLKPLILIPIGMCSSLTTAQLETIFLHELMHIRRKDYLINMVQAFVEAIYFFNPFVWMISAIIKREREHCCDDAVVQLHGNAIEYARALTTLEESRLAQVGLSLSLAENKNQLLNRIKRLMEKSVKNHYSWDRSVPALLLVVGLACASWMSIYTGKNEFQINQAGSHAIPSDTTKKDKTAKREKKQTDSQKKSAAAKSDEKENPINEKDEAGDDYGMAHELEPFPDFDFNFTMPPVPDVAGIVQPMLELDLLFQNLDGPHVNWNEKDWEEFSEEFEKNFQSKFGDFYEKNEADIQKMMEEIQEKLNSNQTKDWELRMNDMAEKHNEWARKQAEHWERQAEKMSKFDEGMNENLRIQAEKFQEQALKFQEDFEMKRHKFEKTKKRFEDNTKAFEDELKKELVEDGYLGADEKLETIQWHDGELKVNGEQIKPEHEKKYSEIREKYFSPTRPAGTFE